MQNAEQKELDLITGAAAFSFRTPKKSFLKHFGKPYREWNVPYNELGIMDLQSALFFKMKVNDDALKSADYNALMSEQFRLVKDNAKHAAEVVAISVLGGKWKIRLFRKVLGSYFYWRLNSANLYEIVNKIFKINNYKDFMLSIVLMNANRTTNPESAKAGTIED